MSEPTVDRLGLDCLEMDRPVSDHALLPATTPDVMARIEQVEALLRRCETPELATAHVLHGGMYARTITMPALHVMTGVMVKRETILIVSGEGFVLAGDEWIEFDGYRVLAGSAGRKQLFVSRSAVSMTMLFPTNAKSVEEAEAEFTDQCDDLLSRKQDANTVVITGQ